MNLKFWTWPIFKRGPKKETRNERELRRSRNERELRRSLEMSDWRNVGDSFQYLGRTCVATNHMKYDFSHTDTYVTATLYADYVDNNGVIHNIEFTYYEFLALKKNEEEYFDSL